MHSFRILHHFLHEPCIFHGHAGCSLKKDECNNQVIGSGIPACERTERSPYAQYNAEAEEKQLHHECMRENPSVTSCTRDYKSEGFVHEVREDCAQRAGESHPPFPGKTREEGSKEDAREEVAQHIHLQNLWMPGR